MLRISSGLSNINHYLKDIKITLLSNSDEVKKIEGTLIIHGYPAVGHSSYEELYLAQFEKVGNCRLPKTIKFSPVNDPNFQRPRMVTEIEYALN